MTESDTQQVEELKRELAECKAQVRDENGRQDEKDSGYADTDVYLQMEASTIYADQANQVRTWKVEQGSFGVDSRRVKEGYTFCASSCTWLG